MRVFASSVDLSNARQRLLLNAIAWEVVKLDIVYFTQWGKCLGRDLQGSDNVRIMI